jgi:2-dehydro-3-deoxygluconokinase
MTNPAWLNRNVVGIGEALVEFAPVGDDLYRRRFAGDTLNICWRLAKLLQTRGRVAYFTKVGNDAFSSEFLNFLAINQIASNSIQRDPSRSIGLYVIILAGAERTFSYWRDSSAARRLADETEDLLAAVAGAGLIHVSGITLAVIGEVGRRNLLKVLAAARSAGSLVSYDPNVRPRLWRDTAEMQNVLREALSVADIALPSFDDEAKLWGDADPSETVRRISAAGVREIVVKNGANEITLLSDGSFARVPASKVHDIRDTTGAGDAFNAGYLAGRLFGMDAPASSKLGQSLAGEIIRHFGALAPESALRRFQKIIREYASES